MLLINCKVNLIVTWSANSIIPSATGETKFAITAAKLYVPVVTLSTQDSAKILQQLKSDFKRIINWNKHQSKISIERPIQYLDYLFDSSFQRVNRHFVLSFKNRKAHTGYFLPKVEIKDYNVMIDGQNFLDQLVKNDIRTNDNIG